MDPELSVSNVKGCQIHHLVKLDNIDITWTPNKKTKMVVEHDDLLKQVHLSKSFKCHCLWDPIIWFCISRTVRFLSMQRLLHPSGRRPTLSKLQPKDPRTQHQDLGKTQVENKDTQLIHFIVWQLRRSTCIYKDKSTIYIQINTEISKYVPLLPINGIAPPGTCSPYWYW